MAQEVAATECWRTHIAAATSKEKQGPRMVVLLLLLAPNWNRVDANKCNNQKGFRFFLQRSRVLARCTHTHYYLELYYIVYCLLKALENRILLLLYCRAYRWRSKTSFGNPKVKVVERMSPIWLDVTPSADCLARSASNPIVFDKKCSVTLPWETLRWGIATSYFQIIFLKEITRNVSMLQGQDETQFKPSDECSAR